MLGLLGFVPGLNVIVMAWNILTSRIGLALIVGLGAFIAGYQYADDANHVKNLQAQIEILNTDIRISREAETLAKAQSVQQEILADKNQERVDALEADLAKRAQERKSCALSESDARRLRNIR